MSQLNMSSSEGAPNLGTISLSSRIALFMGRMRMFKEEHQRGLRPWSGFFDKAKFSYPSKMEAVTRANKNLTFYYSNYILLAALVTIFIIINNLLFVITMALCAAAYGYYRASTSNGEPFFLRGSEITPMQAQGGLGAITLFLFWLTGGSGVIFWVITMSGGLVIGHAATHEAPEEDNGDLFGGSSTV